jgi:hypothetical protein
MNGTEARTVLAILLTAYDRQMQAGLADIWEASLTDVPYAIGRETALELIKVSPHLPRVAEFRERARLVKAAHDREIGKQRQLEGRRDWAPSRTPRTGAEFIGHVMGRLRDAGQNPAEGVWLGQDRARAIALGACREYLARTAPEVGADPLVRHIDEVDFGNHDPDRWAEPVERACARCYAPTVHPSGLCGRCDTTGDAT